MYNLTKLLIKFVSHASIINVFIWQENLTLDEIEMISNIANQMIYQKWPVQSKEVPLSEAAKIPNLVMLHDEVPVMNNNDCISVIQALFFMIDVIAAV